MIGGIFERESATPKSLVCSSKPLVPIAKTKINVPVSVNFTVNQVPQTIKTEESTTENSADHSTENGYESNDLVLDKMNFDEISSAMEEISSLISVKNIQFLCKQKQTVRQNVKEFAQTPNVPRNVEELNGLMIDRYDLDGRRVLLKSSISSAFLDVFNNVNKFNKTTPANISLMSSQFIAQFLAVGLFSVHDDTKSWTEPQNELFNHEQSPKSPGYTLNEVCELCRSEYPNQRIISFRILTGIFTRRDFVTSLNAYRHDLVSVPLKFLGFAKALNNLIKMIVSWEGYLGCEKIVGDLLVDVMFRMCISDSLPSSIPSLLRWSIQVHNSSPALRLSTLQCLQAYLSSAVELSCVDTLWLGFWGTYGVPPLLTPHSKRSSLVTYEEHFVNCREKGNSLSATDAEREGDDVELSAQDMNDSFILSCRWCRVDTMVTESDIVIFLTDAALDGVKCVLKHSSSLPNSPSVAIGLVAVSILHTLVMGASGDATLRIIHEELFASSKRNTLTTIAALVDFMGGSRFNSDGNPNIAALLEEWLRLLAEISRRCAMSAEVLFGSQWDGIFSEVMKTIFQRKGFFLSQKIHGEKTIAWAFRLWRVGLVHGVGFPLLSDLLETVASQKRNEHHKVVLNIAELDLSHSQLLQTELFLLLEQAAVTLSHFARTGESLDDVERCGLVLLQAVDHVVKDFEGVLRHDESEFTTLLHSAQLHFLASVVGINLKGLERTEGFGATLADSILHHTLVRGSGLVQIFQCGKFSSELASVGASLLETLSSTTSVFKVKMINIVHDMIHNKRYHFWRWVDNEKLVAVSRVLLLLHSLNLTDNLILSTVTSLQLSVCVSSVSSGIFSWQSSRLDQVMLLIRLQLLALTDCCSLFVVTLDSLEHFTDSMSGCVVFLFNQVINTILGGTDREHSESVRKSLLTAVLGVTSNVPKNKTIVLTVAPQDIQFGNCAFLARKAEHSTITNWVFDCFTGKIPLDGEWQYKCLKSLKGDDLCSWLSVLHILENFTHVDTKLRKPKSSTYKIFYLLQMVSKEFCVNWFKNPSEFVEMDSKMVDAFCCLIHSLVEYEVSTNFGESLKFIAQVNHFTVSSVLSHRSGRYATSSGLLELCDNLLDSAFSCHLDEDIHAATLRILIIPSIDWVVRERIWKKLGELRLMHLLEGNRWVVEKSVYFAFSPTVSIRSESNVCLAIIDSLISLRAVDDRKWSIVKVGLFQVARFIFCSNGTSTDHTLSACATSLLSHVINTELMLRDQFSPWLFTAILITASEFIFADGSGAIEFSSVDDKFDKLCVLRTTNDQHFLPRRMLDILSSNNELKLPIETCWFM